MYTNDSCIGENNNQLYHSGSRSSAFIVIDNMKSFKDNQWIVKDL